MKISELIARLEEQMQQHGDIDVFCGGFDECDYDLIGMHGVITVFETDFRGHGGKFMDVDRIEGIRKAVAQGWMKQPPFQVVSNPIKGLVLDAA